MSLARVEEKELFSNVFADGNGDVIKLKGKSFKGGKSRVME